MNLEIVRQGYGHAYLNYPFDRMDAFRAAEREAREAGRGLWGESPSSERQAAPTQVWVNAASMVYHCPGTRYYGNTAKGLYMTEAEALKNGYRAAYGRSCGGVASSPPVSPQAPAEASTTALGATASIKVWVNTSSKVYHCPGTRYYGTAKSGTYMRQQDAQAAGHRPASGRYCS